MLNGLTGKTGAVGGDGAPSGLTGLVGAAVDGGGSILGSIVDGCGGRADPVASATPCGCSGLVGLLATTDGTSTLVNGGAT